MNFKRNFLLPFFLLIVLHFLSNIVCAQTQTLNGSNYYGDNVYAYNISANDLQNTPSWKPEQEDPPVSLRKALEIARKNLSRFVKKSNAFEVENINLIQMDGNKWLYDISFHCQKKECQDAAGSNFKFFIKMDGSIVEPKVRKEIKKEVFTIPLKPKSKKFVSRYLP